MAADPITLRLDDGTDILVLVDGEIDDQIAALLSSGDQLRLRADDLDVTGHGPSNVVSVWIAGPDDVSGHALALRLPNAEAAREFQRKLIAGGAIALVVAGGAVTAQSLQSGAIQGQDSSATTISAMAVHPGETRDTLRTDAPMTTSAQAVDPGETRDTLRTDGPPRTTWAQAVHPGEERGKLRTDSASPTDAGSGRLDDDSPNPGK
jgi:hypothetical protein